MTSFGVVSIGSLAVGIAAGGDHTCAILQSGALRCWGRNDSGQLGHGNTDNIGDNEPVSSSGDVDLGPGVAVKGVALGGDHTCALLETGAVRCWGRNDFGQLGYGHTNNLGDDEPINHLSDVALAGPVRKLVAGGAHTCALTVAGTLRCWGRGDSGQLGQTFSGDPYWGNSATELPITLPGDINTGALVTDVTAGGAHTCALSSDGKLKCWGRGDSGQLGYGNFDSQVVPPADGVNLDGVTAYQVAAGLEHTCALRSNGTARCWGAGDGGRLGRGTTDTSANGTGDADVQIFSPAPACGDRTTIPASSATTATPSTATPARTTARSPVRQWHHRHRRAMRRRQHGQRRRLREQLHPPSAVMASSTQRAVRRRQRRQRRRLRERLHPPGCGNGIIDRRRAVRRRQRHQRRRLRERLHAAPSAATASRTSPSSATTATPPTATLATTTARPPYAATASTTSASRATTATPPTAMPARTTAPSRSAATASRTRRAVRRRQRHQRRRLREQLHPPGMRQRHQGYRRAVRRRQRLQR